MSLNLVCFLTVNPSELFYNFLLEMPNKKNIYICIDDNNYEIPNYNNEINIIKIDNKICEDAGFKSSVLWLDNKACSRDKALYYFCKNNIEYDNIWFIEEDVFIPTINTIENIDKKYQDGDLLVCGNTIINEKQTYWHWKHINNQIKIPPPYARSMICAIRCSRSLLEHINNYAIKYNNLFMDEALFNTIALQNNLNIIKIKELSTIHYRTEWKKHDIDPNNLYHPIKSILTQYEYRK
jgi:hypothetical protein